MDELQPGSTREERSDAHSTSSRFAFVGFAVAAGYFLWTEHRAHVIAYLPWVFLLICPLMHVFMHGRHSRHGRHGHGGHASHGSNSEGERGGRES